MQDYSREHTSANRELVCLCNTTLSPFLNSMLHRSLNSSITHHWHSYDRSHKVHSSGCLGIFEKGDIKAGMDHMCVMRRLGPYSMEFKTLDNGMTDEERLQLMHC